MKMLLLVLMSIISVIAGLPSIHHLNPGPIHVHEGDNALLTCIVRDIGEDTTVMWKREDREKHGARVLMAGVTRVTADKRFNVLHDSVVPADDENSTITLPSAGDVWVLMIVNVKPSDTGTYVCELNSTPITRNYYQLNVLSKALEPPNSHNDTAVADVGQQYESENGEGVSVTNHNYTECCQRQNVSNGCLGFCNIQSILEGTTGQEPENCEADFPAIVMCMADGRNHVPCCVQERIPDICQDVCRGEYTPITESIQTHFSCSAYTEQTLACIIEGIELLPSPPEDIEVEALSDKALKVSWSAPTANAKSITEYSINMTSLQTFDQPITDADQGGTLYPIILKHTVHVSVPSSQTEAIVNNLVPFTMYEITVTAVNIHGTSLPTYKLRSLTLTPGVVKPPARLGQAPPLPDVKSCCVRKGVDHQPCMEKLCDPVAAVTMEVTDLMICAPWASDTFGCLANGVDHTPCCRDRGLPSLCLNLCSGNVTNVDFNYFKCVRYMGEYTNCLLQGYGVLPSAPTKLHLSNIDINFVILHWDPPSTLGDTVHSYTVHYRHLNKNELQYKAIGGIRTSPYILEDLDSATDYEVYVEAVNVHGVGEPSARLAFTTDSALVESALEAAASNAYNETACCLEAGLMTTCLPLCSYNANMSDIRALAGQCAGEFHKIVRCGAGSRDHTPCCSRRGVVSGCLTLCAGHIVESLLVTAATCVPYIGNIAQCFEEGAGLLPGPVGELHAVAVNNQTVLLEWDAPKDSSVNATDYVVNYQRVDNATRLETAASKLDNQVNVTGTTATLANLDANETYQIFVLARNRHGTSLPSSILVINLSQIDIQGDWVQAVTSPPHSVAVAAHSATWLTVSWQSPKISHPTEVVTYQVYHRANSETRFTVSNVSLTTYMLNDLEPNTKYIIYVRAVNGKGDSEPSETLIAWTDPAYPAFVEPPTVHPINLVMEGGSMTVLCIAMGTPMPTISLYISGRLVRQETTRHMVTVIHNVTRDMDQISCYADNGYGTPMQASRRIQISHGPHIEASAITMAILNDTVTLECRVEAMPAPKMMFWRSHQQRTPVIQGGRYDINNGPIADRVGHYRMRLRIEHITESDVGDYYCHAENAFGSKTQAVSLRIRGTNDTGVVVVATTDTALTQCCRAQNVTRNCMDACSFYMDVQAVSQRPECASDFAKLMRCAADGSDHRSCCTQRGVPHSCMEWCRGGSTDSVQDSRICVDNAKSIVACFQIGRDTLPGVPQAVRIDVLDAHTANVSWRPPTKNPQTVALYRVVWRSVQDRVVFKADTALTHYTISGLVAGATYECVVKAGNSRGTSTLTPTLRFVTGGNKSGDLATTSTTSQSSSSSSSSSAVGGTVLGILLAILVVTAIVCGAVWLMRTKKLLRLKSTTFGGSNPGVAFENPSYLREVSMVEHTTTIPVNSISGSGEGVTTVLEGSAGGGWKHEQLHVPTVAGGGATSNSGGSTEVNPTLYEELKLGQNGAGFKRLKP